MHAGMPVCMPKLICLDMDGVLTQEKNLWMRLHDVYGTTAEGKEITKRYLHTDYARLVQEVIGRLWLGKDEASFRRLVNGVPLSDGIDEFFTYLDTVRLPNAGGGGAADARRQIPRVPRALITSGPFELAQRIADRYSIDYIFANTMHFTDGKVDGRFSWVTGAGTDDKVRIVEGLCDSLEILPQDVLYIGDSAADLSLFRIVGTSIAFNCDSEPLKTAASYVVDSKDLRDVVRLLEKL
jgi:phosphoserine phosphatase